MNDLQKRRIAALEKVTMLPGIPEKRFARNMAARLVADPEAELTEKQDAWLSALCWKYRRQIQGALPPEQWPDFTPPDDRRRAPVEQREKST